MEVLATSSHPSLLMLSQGIIFLFVREPMIASHLISNFFLVVLLSFPSPL